MSLVGTRPILQDELEQYELHHRARIAIKPGITGMWQVSGRSDITDFEEVVRLDTEYISKSYPMIKKKTDRIKYILIGDGVDREKLKSLVNQLGIQEEVIFLGFRRDVQNVLSQVDLLVLSSLWEGLPLTPIEGFSVGKTVVATAVDGTVEVVDDSKNGYLIPAKNSEKIAEKVLYLFEHPETQKQLEREAYRTFQNEFSFEKFSEKVLNYYEKC